MVIRFGVFEVDLVSGELRKQGLTVRLPGQPFQVFATLLERPGEVVTRKELQDRLWPGDTFVDFDRSLNKCVNRIREVLGDSAESPRYIETIPRQGYRWILPITRHEPPAEPVSAPCEADALTVEHSSRPRRSWAARYVTGAALFISLIAISFVASSRLSHTTSNPGSGLAPIRALAILPLNDVSVAADQEHLAEGLTDALITALASTGELRVISISSALQYKGTKKSIREISRELNVDAIAEGMVIRSNDRVRISVRLFRGESERDIWAGSYEREFGNVLTLEAEVANSIAREIQVRLSPSHGVGSRQVITTLNPAAYESYLKGRFFWNKRTEGGMNRAAQYFEDAIHIDPTYASAYAGLADSYLVRNAGAVPRHLLVQGESLAIKALQLDNNLAEAHASLGRAKLFAEWDWGGARTEFQRSVQLNPSLATARQWYGIYLSTVGRHDEAQAEFEMARRVDPLSPVSYLHIGLGKYFARDYNAAIQEFRKALDLDPNFVMAYRWLGVTYARTGAFEEGISTCQRAQDLGDNWMSIAMLGYAQAAAGRKQAALASADRLIKLSKSAYVSPYLIAAIYSGLGEKESTFKWLDKAYAERNASLPFIAVHGWFDSLRDDRRFDRLVRNIGIPGWVSSSLSSGR
jgi:TolB-like protein/DNA-binding winged helix-turn-helix (wHTH) protein/tetratricopeptide (TPR) repeat protein